MYNLDKFTSLRNDDYKYITSTRFYLQTYILNVYMRMPHNLKNV